MSISLVTGGILLMIGGASSTHSLAADIARLIDGSLGGRGVWMVLAGLVLCSIGLMNILQRAQRGWWDALFSPLSFLVVAIIAALQGFSSNTTLTTSIAGILFVVALTLFLASLLQSNRR